MEMATRLSAAERREDILEAAVAVFAAHGFEGASTDDIAKAAGISQPYLFRLFGTKKELFMATVARCFRETLEMFQRSAEGLRGEDALKAIGQAYMELLQTDRSRLNAQLQAYAACDDAEIRDVVRNGYGDLVSYIERLSGGSVEDVANFFSKGMLLNVLAAMQVQDGSEPWAARLLEGCGKDIE
jgi:AcrR family transcriptional regulator